MKREIRGFIAGVVTTALLTTTIFTAYAAPVEKTITAIYNNIKIYVSGNLVQPKDANGIKTEPFIYNGTTYLPVRAVSQALGLSVDWDSSTNCVYIGGKTKTSLPESNTLPTNNTSSEITAQNTVVKLSVANNYIAVKVLFPQGTTNVFCTGVDGKTFTKEVQMKNNEYIFFDKAGLSPGSPESSTDVGLFYEGDECIVNFIYIINGVQKKSSVKTTILDRTYGLQQTNN